MAVHASSPALLRLTLRANGLFSLGSGILCLVASERLATLLGIPAPGALMLLGLLLLCYGALLLYGASAPRLDARLVAFAIVADILWVVDSVLILAFGWLPLTTTGVWSIAIVADIVFIFAILQILGRRRQ